MADFISENIQNLFIRQKKFVLHTFSKNAVQNVFLCFVLLQNEQCEMWEFFFYCVFGPLFFQYFFLATEKKNKNFARRLGQFALCTVLPFAGESLDLAAL